MGMIVDLHCLLNLQASQPRRIGRHVFEQTHDVTCHDAINLSQYVITNYVICIFSGVCRCALTFCAQY